MTTTNEVDAYRTPILMDSPEGFERPAADCENVVGLIESQLITWPTQHMTATWGN